MSECIIEHVIVQTCNVEKMELKADTSKWVNIPCALTNTLLPLNVRQDFVTFSASQFYPFIFVNSTYYMLLRQIKHSISKQSYFWLLWNGVGLNRLKIL